MKTFDTLKASLQQRIFGQQALIDRLLISLLTGGHVLIEGLPGLAKTSTVQALAEAMAMRFKRIQFTPDLLPGDITGSDIFLPQEGQFRFIKGPLFNDIILADEINRAPPKVQSALLEAMQEHQVTTGDTTRPLAPCFMVIATQNPIEHEGTYPLPEAQLDRFLMKIQITYPELEDELAIVRAERQRMSSQAPAHIPPAILSQDELLDARKAVSNIYIDEKLERYILTLINATRRPEDYGLKLDDLISRGASPRASLALISTAVARAWLEKRDHVQPADIQFALKDVLRHRVALTFKARSEGLTTDDLIDQIQAQMTVP